MLYVLVSGVPGRAPGAGQLLPGLAAAVAYATPFPSILQSPIDLVTGQADRQGGVRAGRLPRSPGPLVLLLLGRVVLARATRKLVVQGG